MKSKNAKCGIYCLYNILTNKFYIGSSVWIQTRFSEHKYALNKGVHFNPYLQNSWNKHGADAFVFFIIEEIPEDQLLIREQWWLTRTECYKSSVGYNVQIEAGRQTGLKQRPESMDKISKEYIIQKPDGTWLKILNLARFSRENNLSEGCLSTISRGIMRGHKGWHCRKAGTTMDDWLAMREERLAVGKAKSKAVRDWICTNPEGEEIKVRNLAMFCKQNNLRSDSMRRLAGGKRKTHRGWKCKHDI